MKDQGHVGAQDHGVSLAVAKIHAKHRSTDDANKRPPSFCGAADAFALTQELAVER